MNVEGIDEEPPQLIDNNDHLIDDDDDDIEEEETNFNEEPCLDLFSDQLFKSAFECLEHCKHVHGFDINVSKPSLKTQWAKMGQVSDFK